MLFDSVPFVFLLALLLPLSWILKGTPRRLLLLAASDLFYGWWDWRFLGLLWTSIFLDYFAARGIERARARAPLAERGPPRGKVFLVASIVGQLGILGYFKYAGFFAGSLVSLLGSLGVPIAPLHLDIVLPIGISFYTFQTMSYTIEVYRGEMKAEHDLIAFALFVTWLPHLVAGPIMRAKRLLPQLREDPRFDLGKISDGVLLIVWGLFEKMVIGDRAALITNAIFGSDAQAAATRTGVDWYIAVVAFAIQIFGDFSGYSDIARGTSRLFGVELIVNFRHPYFAIGPQDFWRRWHISLSTWLRDYLYFSLGGNRKGKLRTKINLFITMLLGGLWHGAAWHYVIWGAYHGTLLTIERALGLDVREPRTLGGRIFRIVLMFQLTLFGWLLFRVESMDQLRQIIAAVARPPVFTEEAKSWARTLSVLAAPLLMVQLNQAQRQSMEVLPGAKDLGRIVFSLTAVALMILFHVRTRIEFIYFQF